jgi:cytochrome c peroxidase
MKNRCLLLCVIVVGVISCGDSKSEPEVVSDEKIVETEEVQLEPRLDHSETMRKALNFFGVLPEIAENPENPITPEKVALGKALYFDVRLSKDNTISCNSCHNLDTYGVDNLSFSPGNDGDLGSRNSPSTLNAALHMTQFWDGREPDVEAQAGGPVLNPVEMAMPSEEAVVERLEEIDMYIDMFDAAFPEDQESITYENMKRAIGAFERKLITKSRFDSFMHGDDTALTNEEVAGLETFISVGCITCHSSAILGGNMYQKFGIYGDYWELTGSEKHDEGRLEATGKESDKYMFKTPSLLNVAETSPYFHDGSVNDLSKAIQIMGRLQLNKELSAMEVAQIETFLKSLTGEVPSELKM